MLYRLREGRMVNTDNWMAEVVNLGDPTGQTLDGKIIWWPHSEEFAFRPNAHEAYTVDALEEIVSLVKGMNERGNRL